MRGLFVAAIVALPVAVFSQQSPGITTSSLKITGPGTLEITATMTGSEVSLTGTARLNAYGGNIAVDVPVTMEPGVPTVIDFDFTNQPRFTETVDLSATINFDSIVWKTYPLGDCYLPLPIIMVSGIQPGSPFSQGDNVFPNLEAEIQTIFNADNSEYGAMVPLPSIRASQYPLVSYVPYYVNRATFLTGAQALEATWNQVRKATHAAKCVIVAHSKGVLVARKYLQDNLGGSATSTATLIAAEGPNTGSYKALDFEYLQSLAKYNYEDLRPTYPYIKTSDSFGGGRQPENLELDQLNGEAVSGNDPPFPESVFVFVVASNSVRTEAGVVSGSFPFFFDLGPWYSNGDGVVPFFSQVGLVYTGSNNPNNWMNLRFVKNFPNANNWGGVIIPGYHFAGNYYLGNPQKVEYLALPAVWSAIYGWLGFHPT